MSEIKHTPGPWRITTDAWGETAIESDNERDNADESQVFVLAKSIGGRIHGAEFDDRSEVEANVSLIASAPELLEALRQVTSDLFYQIETKHGPQAAAIYPSIALARAVIATATE